MLGFRLGTIDVVAAFLQSGPLLRPVFIRLPRGWCTSGTLWKLLKPAYGLVESGRLWQIEVEKWIFSRGFVIIPGAPQVFVFRKDGDIIMILAKVVYDILCCSSPKNIRQFHDDLAKTYELNPLTVDEPTRFAGMQLSQDEDGSVHIDVAQYLNMCDNWDVSAARRKQEDSGCSPDERAAFRTLCGRMSYLGATGMPLAAFAASHLQQQLGDLRVRHLRDANVMLRSLRSLNPKLLYQRRASIARTSVLAFSETAHSGTYG
jgi:Reverse transcriptase (RNA-dependent DNA polymerase)